MRSSTSTRRWRSTRGGGLVHDRAYSRGLRRVRISSTSRKPFVVISPVRAPFNSRIAFDATVVPCSTSTISASSSALADQLGQPVDDRRRVIVDRRGDLLGQPSAVLAKKK